MREVRSQPLDQLHQLVVGRKANLVHPLYDFFELLGPGSYRHRLWGFCPVTVTGHFTQLFRAHPKARLYVFRPGRFPKRLAGSS